jgi:hypothetical protein
MNKVRDRCILFLLLVFSAPLSKAQQVDLEVANLPLNQVLLILRDRYQVEFSFDDQLLARFPITVHASFPDPESAVRYLIRDLPLKLEIVSGVFLIVPESKKPSVGEIRIAGIVEDALTGEPLPYSHVVVNRKGVTTDFNGRFAFLTAKDTAYSVRVSYLGYFIKDSLIQPGTGHIIKLQPALLGIREIVISDEKVPASLISRYNAGEMRLNHKISNYLPGFADNAVYNLLRLQPGILASGEHTNDLIIWGSYEGQSAVIFDGITLYGLRNYNDDIGIVNPYMVKDIKLLKGGYPANYGGKAGGIVEITGFNGDHRNPGFFLSATNLTLTTRLSVPVRQRSAIIVAFRQTYYDLYNNQDINYLARWNQQRKSNVDLAVIPDYMFRDFNLKYAGNTLSGDSWFISMLYGVDRFSYSAGLERPLETYNSEVSESGRHGGLSAFYSKKWQGGSTSSLQLSYSGLLRNENQRITIDPAGVVAPRVWRLHDLDNKIRKLSINQDNRLVISTRHQIEAGVGISGYSIDVTEDSSGLNKWSGRERCLALETYLQDRVSIHDGFNIVAGFRTDVPGSLRKVLFQPRISMNYRLGKKVWFKSGMGIYSQYLVRSSVMDEGGNYRYFWTLSDGEETPVQQAGHLTAGITWQTDFFSLGLEGYLKKTRGLTRYVYWPGRFKRDVYTGEGFSCGLDVLAELRYREHSAWLAYTLGMSLERFPYFAVDRYLRAPHDQRHEIKSGGLLSFHPVYLSAVYVFGSGFPDRTVRLNRGSESNPVYSRLDASLIYRFRIWRLDIHAGISVLNVFNTQNVKLENFVRIPGDNGNTINILAEAVPFTPTLFLSVSF